MADAIVTWRGSDGQLRPGRRWRCPACGHTVVTTPAFTGTHVICDCQALTGPVSLMSPVSSPFMNEVPVSQPGGGAGLMIVMED